MKEQKLRFALFGNEYQSHKSAGLRALLDCLESHNSEVLVDTSCCQSSKESTPSSTATISMPTS